MRTHKISVILGLIVLLAAVVRADRITSDHDRTVNFAKFKTFMWIHGPEVNQPFVAQRIIDSVNAQLKLRGMRLVSEGADLAVGANLATEEEHTWETYYSGSDWGWGGGWATTEIRTYQLGTLTVDLFDAETHKIVWQGVGVDKISPKPERATKDYEKQIEKMFKEFPG